MDVLNDEVALAKQNKEWRREYMTSVSYTHLAPVPVFPADIPPGEEVPLVTWFPVIPEFPEFPDGGEYTLPAEPPSMAEASLRHTPELSKV